MEHDRRNDFKRPPKKYAPKGVVILYEDKDILVVDKSPGLLTVGSEKEPDKTALNRLTDYVTRGNHKSKNKLFVVHRLDRETSGVLIFAKTVEVKTYLMTEWEKFTKTYKAVVVGEPAEAEGLISSYLAPNGIHKMYVTHDKAEGKLAETKYKVAKVGPNFTLLDVELLTGRKHQIRVQLASKGHAVAGDKQYAPSAKGVRRLALHSSTLTINHPFSKLPITFTAPMPAYFESLLNAPKEDEKKA